MSELLMEVASRACTYELLKWNFRSEPEFNPYILSSQGYTCSEYNTLKCIICQNSVCFSDEEGEERPKEVITQQLKNHDASCLYLDEKPIQFDQGQLYLWLDDLIDISQRSYKTPKNLYPLVNLGKFWSEAEAHHKKDLLDIILSRYEIKPNQMKISFVLLVLGWEYTHERQLDCRFCGRRVMIDEECQTTSQDKQDYPSDIEEQKLFDPFDSHRYFCFWVHGPKLWNLYIQSLWDRLGQSEQIFKKKNPEDIKKIRVLLDKYLDVFQKSVGEQFEKVNQIMGECESLANILENEGDEENLQEIKKKLEERRVQMKDYIDEVQNEIKGPLKKIKI